jgi:hypothetical protein
LFPLFTLAQADGFFADAEASRTARNTLGACRRVAVEVEDPELLARLLRGSDWRVV